MVISCTSCVEASNLSELLEIMTMWSQMSSNSLRLCEDMITIISLSILLGKYIVLI